MWQTREKIEATYNLGKKLTSHYFYKQRGKGCDDQKLGLCSRSGFFLVLVAFLLNLYVIFPFVVWIRIFLKILGCLLSYLGWRGGILTSMQLCGRENWGGGCSFFFLWSPWNILFLVYPRSDFLIISASAFLPFGSRRSSGVPGRLFLAQY